MKYRIEALNWRSILFWVSLWLIQSLLISGGKNLNFYLAKNVPIVLLQFLAVQINIRYLFPIFFEKKRFALYVLACIVVIYLLFSISFVGIDMSFLLFMNFRPDDIGSDLFIFDFWRVLSGSSFYSIALICSSVYYLLKLTNEKELTTQSLINKLENSRRSEYIIVKDGHKKHRLAAEDVFYIKGLKEYVVWHTKNKNILSLQTLSSIESTYKHFGLIRVHKSYIININQVHSFQSNSIHINDTLIPIGRTYKSNIKKYEKD